MSWLSRISPAEREYQRYRNVGRELNHKIINACVNKTIIEKAAMMLGLGKGHRLTLDSEDDLSVLMDFSLYEVRRIDGKNQVERYADERGGSNFVERDLLSAMVKSKTGLFKVERVVKSRYHLELMNLLNPEQPIALTDINFSQTMADSLIIFFRPIHTTQFTMTSGIAFVFPQELEQELLTRWQRLERSGDAERYVWFFKKSKRSGLETIYM